MSEREDEIAIALEELFVCVEQLYEANLPPNRYTVECWRSNLTRLLGDSETRLEKEKR